MRVPESLSILAVPGRGQDERVWGGLVSDLRRRHEVALLTDAAELASRVGDVILASSDSGSAAVYAARENRCRAVILLAPVSVDLLPEVSLDPRTWRNEAAEYGRLGDQLRTVGDPEERRSVLADGLMRMIGRELPPADVGRLREMLRDSADVILNPAGRDFRPSPYADELRALELPVLVLAAGQDERSAAIARALSERAPRGELALLETAQTSFPWLAQPDAAAEAVARFLARL